MDIFKADLHNKFTELKNKIALSLSDDKWFILDGGINILIWWHYNTKSTHEESLD